jgi:hypothetical protein
MAELIKKQQIKTCKHFISEEILFNKISQLKIVILILTSDKSQFFLQSVAAPK